MPYSLPYQLLGEDPEVLSIFCDQVGPELHSRSELFMTHCPGDLLQIELFLLP